MKKTFICILLALMIALTNAYAKSKQQPTWDQRFSMKGADIGRTVFWLNPFTFGYSDNFSQRFNMPKRWIEPDLLGVEAVTYRYRQYSSASCTKEQNPNSCNYDFACLMGLYVKNTANIPWKNNLDHSFSSANSESPVSFVLSPEEVKRKNQQPLTNGSLVFYQKSLTDAKSVIETVNINRIDKRTIDDLDYIEGSVNCDAMATNNDLMMLFMPIVQNPINLTPALIKDSYAIEIPASFMQRVKQRIEDEYPEYHTENKIN